MYGKGCPMDFDDARFIARLATKPEPVTKVDAFAELRQVIFNNFRPPTPTVAEPVVWPHVWPWIYGDAFGSFSGRRPRQQAADDQPAADGAAALGRGQTSRIDWTAGSRAARR